MRIWKDLCALGVVVGGLLAGGPHASAAVGWSSTHTIEIQDPQYNMKAFSMAVPVGWKSAASVIRSTGCHAKNPGFKASMEAADGTIIAFLPGVRWFWTANPLMRESMAKSSCPTVDIDTAAACLVNIAAPNLRPSSTLKSVLPLEEAAKNSIAAQQEEARKNNEALAQRYGLKPQHITIDGARVRFTYEEGGKVWEEQVQTIIDCQESTNPPLYKMPSYMSRQCSARNLYIVRAPKGRLEEFLAMPALPVLTRQVQPSPEWVQRLSEDDLKKFKALEAQNDVQFQAIMKNGREQHDALMRRGAEWQANEKANFDRTQQGVRDQRKATDLIAHRSMLDSLGRQDFINPSNGQTIQANAYYDHQWISSDNSTLIQTDQIFDPNGQIYPVAQSWTELVPK